jgi:hypothetical protein
MSLWDTIRNAVIDTTSQRLGLDDGFQARDLAFWASQGALGQAGAQLTQDAADPSSAVAQGIRGAYTYGVSRPLTTGMLLIDPDDSASSLGGGDPLRDAWNASEYVSPGQAIVAGFNNYLDDQKQADPKQARNAVNAAIRERRQVGFFDSDGNFRSGFENNPWGNLVSGVSDASFQFALDPTAAAGKGVKVARAKTFIREVTDKNVAKLSRELVEGRGGMGAVMDRMDGYRNYSDFMNDPWVMQSADPDALGASLFAAGDLASVYGTTAKAERSRVMLAAMGDQRAADELRANRSMLADQMERLRSLTGDVPPPDGLFDEYVKADAALARALGRADNAGVVNSKVGYAAGSRVSAWETNRGRQAMRKGDMDLGFPAYRTFKRAAGLRDVHFVDRTAQTRPMGVVRLKGVGATDGYTELQSQLARAKGMAPEGREELLNSWARAGTTSERKAVAEAIDRQAGVSVAMEYGMSRADAEDYIDAVMRRRTEVAEGAQRNGYLIDVDGVLGEPGGFVHDAQLIGQLSDSVPLLDLDYMRRTMPWVAAQSKRPEPLADAGRKVVASGRWAYDGLNWVVDTVWRPLVLIRGGYAPRNIGEAWGRMAGFGVLTKIARDQGPDGIANWVRNRDAGVRSAWARTTKGVDSPQYADAKARVANPAMKGKRPVDLGDGITAEGALTGEAIVEASEATTLARQLRPGDGPVVQQSEWNMLSRPDRVFFDDIVEEVIERPVDETGVRLFHGTRADFDQFDIGAASYRGTGQGRTRSGGFYFSDDKRVADRFGADQQFSDLEPAVMARRLGLDDLAEATDGDVRRELAGMDLVKRSDDGGWEPVRVEDVTVDDVADYLIGRRTGKGRTVEADVVGKGASIDGVPAMPGRQVDWWKGLSDAEQKVVAETMGETWPVKDPQGLVSRFRTWSVDYGHETDPRFADALRSNGFGWARVMDSSESGGRSVFALPESVKGSKQYKPPVKRETVTTTKSGSAPVPVEDLKAWDDYWDGYERVVNRQLATDPVARKLIAGEPREEVAAWLRSNAQYGLRREKNMTKAQVDQAVNLIANQIDELIPDFLRGDVLDGGLSAKQYAQVLDQVDTGVVWSEKVSALLSQNAETVRFDPWKSFVRGAFKYIGQKPTDTLVRNPYFTQKYQEYLRGYKAVALRQIDPADVTTDMVKGWETQARKAALRDLKNDIYTVERYSNGAAAMRLFSPFIAATNNTIRTWARIVGNDPSVAVRAYQLWNSPVRAGIVYDSETGELVPSDTAGIGLSSRYEMALPIPGPVRDKFGLPEGYKLSPPIASLNVALQSDPAWMPGWGPMVSVPFAVWANREPTNRVVQLVDGFVFPRQGSTSNSQVPGNPFTAALPAWIRQKFNEQDPDGTTRARIEAMLWAQAVSRGETPNPEQIQQQVDGFFTLRVLGSATLPFAAQIKDPEAEFYVAKYREFLRDGEVDGVDPFERFIKEYGPQYAAFTFSVTENPTRVSADVWVQRRLDQLDPDLRAELVAANPALLGLVVNNPDGSSEFNSPVYNSQRGEPTSLTDPTPLRRTQGGAEAVADTQVRAGWSAYIPARRQLDAFMRDRGITSLRSAPGLKAQWDAYVAGLESQYPAWRDARAVRDDNKFQKNVAGLETLLASDDPAARRPEMATLRSYLDARSTMQQFLATQAPAKTLQAAVNEPLRAQWESYVSGLVLRDPKFADIYFQFLDGELVRVED